MLARGTVKEVTLTVSGNKLPKESSPSFPELHRHANESCWGSCLLSDKVLLRATLSIPVVTLQDTLFFYEVFSLRKRSHLFCVWREE